MRLALVIIFLSAAWAYADDSNYNNTIVGERAFGLGGAFTALSDDSSGIYYNPAGIVDSNRDSFSLSASVYSLQKMILKRGFNTIDTNLGGDITSSSLVTIPSTVGSLFKVSPRITAGFNAILYDFRQIKVDTQDSFNPASGKPYYRNMMYIRDIQDQILFTGPGLGIKLSDNVSIGASGFAVLRSFSDSMASGDKVEALVNQKKTTISAVNLSQGIKLDTTSLIGLFGLKYSYENYRFGASLRTRSWRVREDGKIYSTASSYNKGQIDAAVANQQFGSIYDNQPIFGSRKDGISSDSIIPYKGTLGFAYERPRYFSVASDVSVYNGYKFNLLKIKNVAPEKVPLGRVDQQPVINANFGTEYYLKQQYPLRFGAFTNFSSAPKIETGIYSTQEHIDIVGATCSVGQETDNSSTNVGLSYTQGWGESPLPFSTTDPKKTSLDVNNSAISLMISGSYFF